MTQITGLRVGTDFSNAAGNALKRAAALAKQLGVSRGQVCHAMDPHFVRAIRDLLPVFAEIEQKRGYQAEDDLKAAATALEAASGVSFTRELEEGHAAELLVQDSDSATLVVLGAKGYSNMADVLLGSTAEKVIRQSNGSVLIVRQDADNAYQRVLVPVDFSADSTAALNVVRQIAPDAQLHLLHIIAPLPQEHYLQSMVTDDDVSRYMTHAKEDASEKMAALIKQAGLDEAKVLTHLDYGYAPTSIEGFASRNQFELIAMGKQGHIPLSEWLLGSVTQYVVNHVSQDVLVVKP